MVQTLLISLMVLLAHGDKSDPQDDQKQGPDYVAVIKSMPWNAEKSGPLIAPCPLPIVVPPGRPFRPGWGHLGPRKVGAGASLQDIERMRVRIGGVTAVVPTKMTTVDTNFTEPPNVYDGLPREAKVLYLLTLLDADQWSKAINEGISLTDCRGIQVAVMQSILPKPFSMTTVTMAGGPWGIFTNPDAGYTDLSDDDRAQVRIKLVRDVYFSVWHGDRNGNGRISDWPAKGTIAPALRFDEGTKFGHRIRVESPNVARESQLSLADRRFDVRVALVDGESVGDLVSRLAAASGIELYADPHYTGMKMVELGRDASARDLLKALSLGVTGTYRRVGAAYVLTCDLIGAGAHYAQLAAWFPSVGEVVDQRTRLWLSMIRKSGELSKVKFSTSKVDSLSQAELANMEQNDLPGASAHWKMLNTTQASDVVRTQYGGFDANEDRIDISSLLRYELILPDGKFPITVDTWSLCNFPDHAPVGPKSPPAVDLPLKAPAGVDGLLLRADSAPSAQEDVERVHKFGLGHLWLQTDDVAALRAATAAADPLGIKVEAVVRPWDLTSARTGGLDITAAGDHGGTLAASEAANLQFQELWQNVPAYPPVVRDQISPLSPATKERFTSLGRMTDVKGLAGFALLDAFPVGYAKETHGADSWYWYSNALDIMLSFGYSEPQRLQHLRTEHVDPADIEPFFPMFNVSILEEWCNGEVDSGWQAYEKWQHEKGVWMHDAVLKLATTLAKSGKPILLPGQPIKAETPPYPESLLFAWNSSSDLPVIHWEERGDEARKTCDALVIRIADDEDEDQRNRVAANLLKRLADSRKPIVLDFSDVPESHLDRVLKVWLKAGTPLSGQ